MLPLISIGIAAGLFFGLLSLSAAGKFYFLFQWKRKKNNNNDDDDKHTRDRTVENGGGAWKLCWRKPSPVHDDAKAEEEDVELGLGLSVKTMVEEGIEAELMRMHNLCGPPRFLFTIKEETAEDLSSDEAKTSMRLIDLMRATEADFLSPISSPMRKLSPKNSVHSNGFLNPLFESSGEAELNRVLSSPPPKFKFLRDAEEKFERKSRQETERGQCRDFESGNQRSQIIQ